MRRQRRTKVVATLGPASSDRVTISRLFAAGADVFRINMSHTNPERMRELVTTIRAIETEHGRPIGVLVDLQGPKLRRGTFKDGAVEIDIGQDFTLDGDAAPGDANRVQLPHPEIFAAIKQGDTLLIDDGKLRLKATEVTPQRIVARAEVGGKVSNRKGVSLPDTVLPLAALASKDIADLEAALDAGVDWIALSFIQRPEDVAEAKKPRAEVSDVATAADAIAAATRQVAETVDLAAIVCWTCSGSTGLRVSRERPKCPIVAISPIDAAGRKLSVVWGIHCVIDEDARDQNDIVERACRIAFKERFAQPGQRVIVVAGLPLGTPGATNFMRVAYVTDDGA